MPRAVSAGRPSTSTRAARNHSSYFATFSFVTTAEYNVIDFGTSGSTSTPKGAVHTHAALLTHQRNLNEIRALTQDDKLFCNSPFFWIGGFAFGLLATLIAGSTLVCSNATESGRTLDLLEAEHATVTNGFAAGIANLAHDPSRRAALRANYDRLLEYEAAEFS